MLKQEKKFEVKFNRMKLKELKKYFDELRHRFLIKTI